MFKLKTVTGSVVILAVVTLAVWQELRARRLMAETETLGNRLEQSATLREENEHLTAQLQLAAERARVDASELARSRGQNVRLRQVEQENVRLKAEHERLARRAQSSSADAPEPTEPPSDAEIQLAKGFFGRDIGLALIMAANANEGVVPVDLRGPVFDIVEMFSAGAKHNLKVSQFELMFTGSLRDLKEGETGILAREKEPVQRADGQWERVYVMTDGSGQRISSPTREGFDAKEKNLAPAVFKQ